MTRRFILLGLLVLAFSCARRNPEATYRVALRYLPQTGNPYTSQINTDNFIMLQLYYPLFERSSDGSLKSEFLDLISTRASDTGFRAFSLCLRTDAKFSDNNPIEVADLEYSLKQTHHAQELLPPLESIKSSGKCVEVTLKAPEPRYFDKLTGIASTVTSRTRSKDGFPIGLGPYRVTYNSPESLILNANPGRVAGSFKTIEFRKFTSFSANLPPGAFDFNHTGQVKISDAAKQDMLAISRPYFKSYAVVVNYSEEFARKQFARCFPAAKLRSILDLSLKPTEGFLPSGVQGADNVRRPGSAEHENCSALAVKPITFLNYRTDLRKDIQKLLRDIGKTSPIPIRYEEVSVDELVRRMFHDDRISAVIGFDSSTSNSSAYAEGATFFESFIRTARTERMISHPVPGLEELVTKSARSSDPLAKEEGYRKANRLLLDSGYVVPLGQLDTDQYYPRWIHNISWMDQISGFPNISVMEVAR